MRDFMLRKVKGVFSIKPIAFFVVKEANNKKRFKRFLVCI